MKEPKYKKTRSSSVPGWLGDIVGTVVPGAKNVIDAKKKRKKRLEKKKY